MTTRGTLDSGRRYSRYQLVGLHHWTSSPQDASTNASTVATPRLPRARWLSASHRQRRLKNWHEPECCGRYSLQTGQHRGTPYTRGGCDMSTHVGPNDGRLYMRAIPSFWSPFEERVYQADLPTGGPTQTRTREESDQRSSSLMPTMMTRTMTATREEPDQDESSPHDWAIPRPLLRSSVTQFRGVRGTRPAIR